MHVLLVGVDDAERHPVWAPLQSVVHMRVTTITPLDAAVAFLQQEPVDAILLDPHRDVDAISRAAATQVPVVILIEPQSTAMELHALELGAQDVFCPPDAPPEVGAVMLRRTLVFAIERKRWVVQERARAELEREALLQLSRRLAAVTAVQDVGLVAAEESRRLFGHDAFTIRFFDESTQMVWTLYAEDTPEDGARPVPVEFPLTPLEERPGVHFRQEVVNRWKQPTKSEFVPFGFRRFSRSLMFAPIHQDGRGVGRLSVHSYTPGKYLERDLRVLQSFADQCGGAVARLKAQETLRRREDHFLQTQKLEALGRLAGGVAHDFNNLLTAITGFCQLLRDKVGGDATAASDLDEISRAADRAATLTRQLLAFSRRQVVLLRPLDLHAVVDQMHMLLRRTIPETIGVTWRPSAATGWILSDRAQVEQTILNLAINARDAMPDGGRLTISTRDVAVTEAEAGVSGDKPGAYVALEIEDTGCGMDAATLSRLFEPFFTTKSAGRGTGLGLAMVYGAVEQSGGFIRVESRPKVGTVVRLHFPASAPAADREPATSAGACAAGHETILLVEDEDAVREIARATLARSGYRILPAASPSEALELFARCEGAVDMLLTDVIMPQMAGPELARALRKERPDLPVLYMSGYAGTALPEGEDDVVLLEKPFQPDQLARTVRQVLDRPSRR